MLLEDCFIKVCNTHYVVCTIVHIICLLLYILYIRLLTPSNQHKVKEESIRDGVMRLLKLLSYNITRFSNYERFVYGSHIPAVKYILIWASKYSDLMWNYCSSMPVLFGLFASKDIYDELGMGVDLLQTQETFPQLQLKNTLIIGKNIKCMMTDIRKALGNTEHRFDDELWPYLSKFQDQLESFELFGMKLNDTEFIDKNGDIYIKDFGDLSAYSGIKKIHNG